MSGAGHPPHHTSRHAYDGIPLHLPTGFLTAVLDGTVTPAGHPLIGRPVNVVLLLPGPTAGTDRPATVPSGRHDCHRPCTVIAVPGTGVFFLDDGTGPAPGHQDRQAGRADDSDAHRAESGIREAMRWALDHLDQPISTKDLAARAVMSTRSLTRHFKAVNGVSPYQWLSAVRLERAAELLRSTDLRIQHIAHLVGYSNDRVFRARFIQRHGVAPLAYRRMAGFTAPSQAGRESGPRTSTF
ncbi:helix-turn-helix domain-containing protein [Nonomuraea sp. NPDC050783]|uniref:helix-turn-helix domain-containing protein n=1 Tax=Nonomuraea sp. NPDC050783 TaxID=3154634 RepID=UPI003465F682